MNEEVTYSVNDTNRAIGKLIEDLRAFESPKADPRIKAMILTQLELAQLLSLKLVKD